MAAPYTANAYNATLPHEEDLAGYMYLELQALKTRLNAQVGAEAVQNLGTRLTEAEQKFSDYYNKAAADARYVGKTFKLNGHELSGTSLTLSPADVGSFSKQEADAKYVHIDGSSQMTALLKAPGMELGTDLHIAKDDSGNVFFTTHLAGKSAFLEGPGLPMYRKWNPSNSTHEDFVIYSAANKPTAGDVGAAPASHSHSITAITDLATQLASKAPTVHTHTTAQVTGLDTALAGKASADSVYAKNATYSRAEVDNKVAGYVPTSRKVNGHALTADISLTAGDVGAYSKAEIDGQDKQFVPTSRTVNGHPLTGNVVVNAGDVLVPSGTANANTNLNSLGTSAGILQCPQATWATPANNYPIAEAGIVILYKHGVGAGNNGSMQEYRTYSTGRIFTRTWNGSAWSGWVEQYSTGHKPSANDVGAAAVGASYTKGESDAKYETIANANAGFTARYTKTEIDAAFKTRDTSINSINTSISGINTHLGTLETSKAAVGASYTTSQSDGRYVGKSFTLNGHALSGASLALTNHDVGAVGDGLLGTTDLNNPAILTGFYTLPANCINTPHGAGADAASAGAYLQHMRYDANHMYQLYFRVDGLQYFRYKASATWSGWELIYTTAHKPTPGDIGAYTKAEADGRYVGKTQHIASHLSEALVYTATSLAAGAHNISFTKDAFAANTFISYQYTIGTETYSGVLKPYNRDIAYSLPQGDIIFKAGLNGTLNFKTTVYNLSIYTCDWTGQAV